MEPGKKNDVGPLARAAAREIRAHMARQHPQITGRDLAARAGLSQNYVARRLREEISLSLNDMEVMSRALGLSPERIFADAVQAAKEEEARMLRDREGQQP